MLCHITLEVGVVRRYAAVDDTDDAAFAGVSHIPDGSGSGQPHARGMKTFSDYFVIKKK